MTTVLSNLRKNAEYIKALTLSSHHVNIDFDELLDAIETNTTVCQVTCHDKFMARLTANQISSLLRAFADLPKLQELSISFPSNRSHLSDMVVVTCATNSPLLSKLVLRGFDENACFALATCLRSHPSLQVVELVDGSCGDAMGKLAESIDNNTILKRFQMHCIRLTNGDIHAMARALTHNQTLNDLDLNCNNTSDQHKVDCTPLVRLFRDQKNESLHSLQTNAPEEIQSELNLYTHFNCSGAPQLLRDCKADVTQWLDVILSVQQSEENNEDALSVLVFTLLQEPRFLLLYNAARDPNADKPARIGQETTKPVETPVTPKMVDATKLRAKAVNAPPCWGLNIPWED